MHILFLTHYFPPEVNAPASRTYEHAKRWVNEPGIRVTVVTNHPNHPKGVIYPGYKNRWWSREKMEGIDVIRVKTLLAPNAGFLRRILNYLGFMVAAVIASFKVVKPDVVIATSPQFFCAVAGCIVSRIKRRPFVFELRDLWPESIVTVGAMRPSLAIRMLEKLELFLYRRAALVVCVTDSFKSNLMRRGICEEKIVVIKNGVELAFFEPRSASASLKREIGAQHKFVVSYIGTIGMAHAVDTIVEAAVLLRNRTDILFLVVGEGANKARIENLVKARSLENIKIKPGVSKQEVRELYAVSDLILVTLRNQPLFLTVIPSKIFEVMAMAKPILTTVDGESRHIIESAGSGVFVPPENPSEMADCITTLVSEPDQLDQMGARGRNFVEINFERKTLAHEFLTVLRNVCQSENGH